MKELKKSVPRHTKTIRFRWVRREFMPMTQSYREVRAKCANPMNSCFWCKHKFNDGEMMALGQPEKGPNRILCHGCVDQMIDKSEGANP